jgi:putative cell wall-binding protein
VPGVPVLYIANGSNFPDALSGAPIAGANKAPVLLVSATSIPAAIAVELGRLKPGHIVVLGGTGSISAALALTLADYIP